MIAAVKRFWFEPASPRPLGVLRIGIAVTLLVQALSLRADVFDLFGSGAILQGPLSAYNAHTPFGIYYWLALGSRAGISESSALTLVFLLYIAALVAMLVGLGTRVAITLVWLIQMLLTQAQTTSYGLDQFAHTALFLLLWMPAGRSLALDCRRNAKCDTPDWQARVSLRTLQLWLCIAYLACGLTKAAGEQWWNGEAIWRALMLPTYLRFPMAWLARYPWLARILGLGTLVIETGYPIFIWPRQTRKLWVALTLSLHLGIAIFLRLQLFSLIMGVLTFSLFGLSAEPRGRREDQSHAASDADIEAEKKRCYTSPSLSSLSP